MEAASGTSPIELDGQYRVLREEAGHLGREDRRLIRVHGSEAAEYLQGQLTNDVEGLEPGFGCYSALLDRKGRMRGDMRVLRIADGDLLLDVEGIAGDTVLGHLDMYRIGRDAELDDLGPSMAVVSVIGPAAVALLDCGPVGPEHAHREGAVAGVECRLVATDVGVDLLLDADRRAGIERALAERGIERVEPEAAELIRIESGRPRFGRDMGATTIPQEAGINERAVSFTKGCYIGQETVARLHYKGKPNRHLRGLRLSAPGVAGEPIRFEEREVGTLGSAAVSPVHGAIGLAILRREAAPGSVVEVGADLSAEVGELPF